MATDDNKPFDPNDSNPDPITQESGAHPVGTGLGAAYTGVLGTAVGGAFGGPVGAIVGAAIGAVSGGLLGKAAAESVNPTIEDEYWRTHYSTRSYIEAGRQYEDYQPAYQAGYQGYHRYAATGKGYDEVEPELQRDYETRRGRTGLAWEKAKHATKDAWERLENSVSSRNVPQDPVSGQDSAIARSPGEVHYVQRESTTQQEFPIQKEVDPDRSEVDDRLDREQLAVEREQQARGERTPNDPMNRI